MGDLFAGAVHLHWCADYFYRAGYLVKWMNQKIQLPDFLLASKPHFCSRFFPPFLSCWRCIRHHPLWWLDQRRYPYCADCAGEKGALMYAMGIAAATAIDLVARSTKPQVLLPSALPLTSITGHRSFYRYRYSADWSGAATIIDRRLTGKRLFHAQLYPRVRPPCSWRLWGSVRVRFRCAGKPHHRHSVVYGRRYCRLTAAVWLGAVQWFPESAIWACRWSLTWASIWRGSRWGQS